MNKEAFYFSHDSNALSDEKIQCLVADHGMEGYGIYWALIERMFESKETQLSHNLLRGLAFNIRVDITLLSAVITTCINVTLFVTDGEFFYSESLRRRKNIWDIAKQKKSEAGKIGMAKRWAEKSDIEVVTLQSNNNVNNKPITPDNTVITEDNKGKERKGNKKNTVKAFVPPTIEESIKHFLEKGATEEYAKRAHEYYENLNWHDSHDNKILNWKNKFNNAWLTPDKIQKALQQTIVFKSDFERRRAQLDQHSSL